jgi:hypothetical protein
MASVAASKAPLISSNGIQRGFVMTKKTPAKKTTSLAAAEAGTLPAKKSAAIKKAY